MVYDKDIGDMLFETLRKEAEYSIYNKTICRSCPECFTLFTTESILRRYCTHDCRTRAKRKRHYRKYRDKQAHATSKHKFYKTTEYKHCLICGTILLNKQMIYCKSCNISLLDSIREKTAEKQRAAAAEYARRARYKKKKLAAIGKAALELFPHLEDLLHD